MSPGDDTERDTDNTPGLPDGATEPADGNQGLLSYAAEWHALTHGIYMGITTLPWVTPPEPKNRDVEKERHYYRGGYLIGTAIQWAIIVLGIRYGLFPMAPATGGNVPGPYGWFAW